jgi:hypothetical protein
MTRVRKDSVERHYMLVLSAYQSILMTGFGNFGELCRRHKVTNAIGPTMEKLKIIERTGKVGLKIQYKWIGVDPTREMAENLVVESSTLTREKRVESALSQTEKPEVHDKALFDKISNVELMLQKIIGELGISLP